ncbi:MAG: sensor N-terminal transmembrane domain-containing protein, partial [Alphaproteobacteria bacterium]|nr:sensor N-terminal transmembrane domain-containing protein [Alphaproteobacteria bacterium]
MASDTAIAKAEPAETADDDRPRRPQRFGGSRLGGFILALNLLSLLILFVGALLLNEWTRGLIEARQETLTAQAELLVQVLGEPQIGVT